MLIQWESEIALEATWEDASLLVACFRTFNLEDKVKLQSGGIVMPYKQKATNLITYHRKRKGKMTQGVNE